MLRRALIAALPLLVAAPALASEEKKKSDPKDIGQYVDLASVALPIVVGGQLVNYVFVSVRVVLTTSANAGKLRALEPFFRDALVKAAHRTPFTNPNDYATIDVPRLQAALLREAIAIGGQDNVRAISVLSQTPKQRVGLPKPKGRPGSGDIAP
jgi:hypothetical protein